MLIITTVMQNMYCKKRNNRSETRKARQWFSQKVYQFKKQ